MTNIESFDGISQREHDGRGTAWLVMLTACLSFWGTAIFLAVSYL
jgi:hypothetical protein